MLDKLFSIKNEKVHKVIRLLGIKFKFLSKKRLYKKMQTIPIYGEFSLLNIYLLKKSNQLTIETKRRILSQKFYEATGKFPDFRNPKSLNEKTNWIKIYYNNPLQKRCVDKYEFKKYIESVLGKEYVIPLLGVYDNVEDIDFDKLPNQFVIKSTVWGGGAGLEIVKDKRKLDIDFVKYKFTRFLQKWRTVYYSYIPNMYEDLEPRIIIEEYMPIREGKALEYKMFCFHGEMKFCLIECDYFGLRPKRAFYDKQFREMPFKIGDLPKTKLNKKPNTYDKIVELAEKLAVPFPFVRIDFYDINGKIYLGEFTFNSGGGFSKYKPDEWDYKLGEWLDLNKLEPEYVSMNDKFCEGKNTNAK